MRLASAAGTLLATLALPAAAAACPAPDLTLPAATPAQVEESALCVVNEVRVAAGARPLQADGRLVGIARAHAADMVDRGYYAHTSPGGGTLTDRLRRAGWPTRSGGRFGENLFTGSGGLSAPADAIAAWRSSAPHRATLLDRTVDRAGVGVAHGMPGAADDGATFVLLVAKRPPATKAKKAKKAKRRAAARRHGR